MQRTMAPVNSISAHRASFANTETIIGDRVDDEEEEKQDAAPVPFPLGFTSTHGTCFPNGSNSTEGTMSEAPG